MIWGLVALQVGDVGIEYGLDSGRAAMPPLLAVARATKDIGVGAVIVRIISDRRRRARWLRPGTVVQAP